MTNQIADTIPFEYEIVKEDVAEGVSRPGNLRIRGVFQRADVKNGNGRVYERRLMEREVKKIGEAIGNRQIVGEVDHPDDGTMKLGHASHLITKLEMQKDGSVLGELEILPTVYGDHLRALAETGVRIGISSRGLGTTSKREGTEYVNDDYQLRTFDVVSDPSTPGAWGSLVHENKEAEKSTDMENKKRFDDLKEQIAQIIETKIESLEVKDRQALVAKAEGLIESLDRVGQEDPGFRSLTGRYIQRLSASIDEASTDKTTPSAREEAAIKVIEALTAEFKSRQVRKDEKVEKVLANVLEKFQAARHLTSRQAEQLRRSEHRNAVTMAVGEELLSKVRKVRIREAVDALLAHERFSHLAEARPALLRLQSIKEVKQVIVRLAEEIKPPRKKEVTESRQGKTAAERVQKLQPKKVRLTETAQSPAQKSELAETFDMISRVTGLK